MTLQTSYRQAVAIPLILTLLLLVAARALRQRTAANVRECAACATAAQSLAPYLEQARNYDAVKTRLQEKPVAAVLPELPLGVPPAEHSSERGSSIDGWVAIREFFTWPTLKTGQAFAILEAFSSAKAAPWRIAALRLEALPDGENALLSVTLERVESAPESAESQE